MGSQLEQVKMVCCQLDDKRVNIRKKAHDQLRDLLNNSQIVATIDRVSVTGIYRAVPMRVNPVNRNIR